MKPANLAARADFRAGPLEVNPSRRRVAGPAGEAQLEPVVMQIFLVLLDSPGQVVTRDALFEAAWGDGMVGDDSLNRAIARVRRVGEQVAPGLFEIETIPRTGYRLIGEMAVADVDPSPPPAAARLPRRAVVFGGLAAAGAGGLGLWWAQSRKDRAFEALLAKGEQALVYDDPTADPAQHFRRAVALRPGDPRALGRFAYARAIRVDRGEPGESAAAVDEAGRASRAALAQAPDEPYARLASIVLERSTLDFAATEGRLRQVLASAPDNVSAMHQLWNVMQCVGRSSDALALVERANRIAPLGAGNHFPRAQLLWILGRTAEADRVIDRAIQFWPSHRYVRFARFTILAFTGRARAALAMLNDKALTPQHFTPASIDLWRVSLRALDDGSPAAIAAAIRANANAPRENLRLSGQAVMTLSVLGDVDSAFEITDALFAISRGPGQAAEPPAIRPPVSGAAWRFAPWLFIPPTANLRSDPRFQRLCDEIGLTDYWSRSGSQPDYRKS